MRCLFDVLGGDFIAKGNQQSLCIRLQRFTNTRITKLDPERRTGRHLFPCSVFLPVTNHNFLSKSALPKWTKHALLNTIKSSWNPRGHLFVNSALWLNFHNTLHNAFSTEPLPFHLQAFWGCWFCSAMRSRLFTTFALLCLNISCLLFRSLLLLFSRSAVFCFQPCLAWCRSGLPFVQEFLSYCVSTAIVLIFQAAASIFFCFGPRSNNRNIISIGLSAPILTIYCLANWLGWLLIASPFVFGPRFVLSVRPFSLFATRIFFCSWPLSNNRNLSSFELSAPTYHASCIVSQDSDDVFYCLADLLGWIWIAFSWALLSNMASYEVFMAVFLPSGRLLDAFVVS